MEDKNLIPIKDIKIGKFTADEIVRQMYNGGGFTAKKVGEATEILEEMEKDKKCVKFLSFTADIIATGLRGVIKDLIKNKFFD
ncbi:MAG: deoxyhypusine synthase family protein, partial [Candidatus Altarchaeaceae archaeon]